MDGESALRPCPICSVDFNSQEEFEEHKSSPQHRVRWLKHWYQTNRLLLAQDKNGVVICPQKNNDTTNVTFEERSGTVCVSLLPGGQKSIPIVIKNTGKEPVILRQIEMLHSCPTVALNDHYGVVRGERFVRVLSGVEYPVDCHTQGGSLGVLQVPVAFQFKPEQSDELFFIVRTVQVNVLDSVAQDSAATSPYEKPSTGYPLRHEFGSYIPGVPVVKQKSKNGLTEKIPLHLYKYKPSLKHIASKNFNPNKVAPNHQAETKKLKDMMKAGLGPHNYVDWFETMLWIEEMQMELDIRYYSIPEAQLRAVSPLIYSAASCVELEVLGLSENRPSILRGDNVYVTHLGKRKPVYAGCVHKVNDKSIYLAFDPRFMETFLDKQKVSVEFEFNRHPLKVSHRALNLTRERALTHLTFPSTPPAIMPQIQNIVPYNRKLENNKEQMLAVCNIVSGTSKPAPYIVFGPPGTGKTVTIVEAIKQVYKLQPNSRVLASAPSNAAADLIAQRLLEHVSKNHMIRLHAISRHVKTIPDQLLDISNVKNYEINFPTGKKLQEYRIIVCTMVTAARIVSASLPSGHLTHVFLDECGHAMEPEAMVPLAGMLAKDSQVVLAGDPYQLGPVIRNSQCYSSEKLFSNNGLDKSYLERLMEMEMYQDKNGTFNHQVVTKLLNNYRSHKDILKEPNEMFYRSQLKVCADQVYVTSMCNWEHLPKKNFPLIFHAARGRDDREGTSPSFFNALEVSTVIGYVKKLLDTRSPKVMARDIGIITPYRRQVEKIRNQLRKVHNTNNLKVGSPEEFQGDERRVIIISTVRASADQLANDQVFKLGFLRNPKRFNVSVTRAKALLIIVGCPEILQLDEHWGKLLDFIRQRGGYRGHSYSRGGLDDFDDILTRFENLNLRPVLGEDVSARELAEAPEWRAEH
ncbi:putative helicase mov-10-B.1 isoform X2 [Homarus americanus]|uniref:putative helicase mov-10-B.1 isoform X2 n=1 Tax=Homarus americanus TaxID=6706 RepID=UPI001C496449|nr:putative helicase mov-10-B.1 isoform X2 [Homarus americanus]